MLYRLDDTQQEKQQISANNAVADAAAIIEEAKRANSEAQFVNALWTLASIRSDAAMAYLNAVSISADEARASVAVETLKKVYTQETSIPALIAGMQSAHPLVRASIADLLLMRSKWLAGNVEVVEALMTALRDPIYNIRFLCAAALGDIGGKDVVPALLQAWKVAARDGYFPDCGYVDGGAPQFLVMKAVEDSLKKLVPAEADQLIQAAEQDGSLSELARSWIDYRRSPSSRNYRRLLRRVH